MNALKGVAGVDDAVDVISNKVIEPICELKTGTLHSRNPRLHSDLKPCWLLSVTSATDSTAKKLIEHAGDLKGCDAFFSVIISHTDEKLYRTLGINVCCEPKYEQRQLLPSLKMPRQKAEKSPGRKHPKVVMHCDILCANVFKVF